MVLWVLVGASMVVGLAFLALASGLTGDIRWVREMGRPLQGQACATMLNLITTVNGGQRYHQQLLAQHRTVRAFDLDLLRQAKRAQDHRAEAPARAAAAARDAEVCRRLHGLA